jgi:hypothetical protein
MIYSMFIMRWTIWRVLFCKQLWHPLEKITYDACFWSQFLHFSKRKKLAWFILFATTFSPLELTLFNLIFVLLAIWCFLSSHTSSYLNLSRNENNSFLRFFFFCGFPTHFTTTISKTTTLSNEKKFNQRNSKSTNPNFVGCKTSSFLPFKCYNLAIYVVNFLKKIPHITLIV